MGLFGNELAPICLTTYVRLRHLQRTVRALQMNKLAKQSELYIFSDGPRLGDEEKVRSVRKYLETVDGFKNIYVFKGLNNDFVENNVGGMRMLLDKYGKMIFLEEDIVTAPGFLTFLNESLNRYKGNNKIFSVSGYCPPINIPLDYEHDIFLLRRFNAWGFGIWKDRFDLVRSVSYDEYNSLINNKYRLKRFVDGGGIDMLRLLTLDVEGKINAFDVRAMYAQFLTNQYTVYPTRSLTMNIGHDGTGLHCGVTKKFDVVLSNKMSFKLPSNLDVDYRINKANLKFRRDGYLNGKIKQIARLVRFFQ